ncbi:hypothetical protein B0H21DRAFT_157133 [Amylocystis lapponica]|nr:hypothetical protein B0H21DRAFT_157133 [Amylocystis lapponica]
MAAARSAVSHDDRGSMCRAYLHRPSQCVRKGACLTPGTRELMGRGEARGRKHCHRDAPHPLMHVEKVSGAHWQVHRPRLHARLLLAWVSSSCAAIKDSYADCRRALLSRSFFIWHPSAVSSLLPWSRRKYNLRATIIEGTLLNVFCPATPRTVHRHVQCFLPLLQF